MFSRKTLASILCAVSILTVAVGVYDSEAITALRVSYAGKIIGIIRNTRDFDAAVQLVNRTVYGCDVADAVEEPVYTTVKVPARQLDNRQTVAQGIIANTEKIVQAYAVCVNGEMRACVDDEKIFDLCDQARRRFEFSENAESNFVDDVTITPGYYLATDINTMDMTAALLEELPVETVYTESFETVLPFKTVKKKSDELLYGTTEKKTDGECGIALVAQSVVMRNGMEISREETEKLVVSKPTDKVVLVGTKHPASTAKPVKSGFTFPLPRKGWVVSAYYGDGRGHRAVDIACDQGTPIYGVLPGKVEFAGWDGEYGYCVVINHGKGLKTRYAHATELFVKKGDKVTAGQNIAAVGQTGLATGNHLHFEVIVHGDRVNPAPYIGL